MDWHRRDTVDQSGQGHAHGGADVGVSGMKSVIKKKRNPIMTIPSASPAAYKLFLKRQARAEKYQMTLIHADSDLLIHVFKKTMADGKIVVMGYRGKKEHPSFFMYFNQDGEARNYIDQWVEQWQKNRRIKLQMRVEQRVHRAQGHALRAGDVLRATWGHEQTNVD
jgi:hypothetical protein